MTDSVDPFLVTASTVVAGDITVSAVVVVVVVVIVVIVITVSKEQSKSRSMMTGYGRIDAGCCRKCSTLTSTCSKRSTF